MFCTFKGYKQAVPRAAPIVSEYIERKRLAGIGFTSPLSDLPAWKAEAFVFIDSQLDKLQAEEMKKKQRAGKHGKR